MFEVARGLYSARKPKQKTKMALFGITKARGRVRGGTGLRGTRSKVGELVVTDIEGNTCARDDIERSIWVRDTFDQISGDRDTFDQISGVRSRMECIRCRGKRRGDDEGN